MLAAGADALKLFPAEAANPSVLRALLAVLQAGTAVLPVGGIDAVNIAGWRGQARPASASVRQFTGPATSRRRLPPRHVDW
jgi:2-keto-3-deoxy-6-phosphogluconate aldolase